MRWLIGVAVGLLAAVLLRAHHVHRARRRPEPRTQAYARRAACAGPYDQEKAVAGKRAAEERDRMKRQLQALRAAPPSRLTRLNGTRRL